MTDLDDQVQRLRSDLRLRGEELARARVTSEQRAGMAKTDADHLDKMQGRLQREIAELERYIASLEAVKVRE